MHRKKGMCLSQVMVTFMLVRTCLSDDRINRGSFSKGFVFGTASSASQYKGAVKVDGRGPSIGDTFANSSGKIIDASNADVAVNQYHRYKEDVQLMKDMGMDAYRFSISWSRIFPGIEPYVTLYHWDLPQALEDKYGGYCRKDFAVYAETCFEEFGDRVKHWITFNEPHTFSVQGYDVGLEAPGRCSILLHLLCRAGNSATEPYIVALNVLLSHSRAFETLTNSTEDVQATKRALDFQLGWFLDPLMFGDYPSSMRKRAGKRLPKFSRSESSLIKGSFIFLGINHYTNLYAWHNTSNLLGELLNDTLANSGALTFPFTLDGKPIGDRANSKWLYIVPEGMRRLMNYIKQKYGNPPIIITENGMDDPNGESISIKDALKDEKMIKYHKWTAGYTSRFGLYFVDYNSKLKR
ncbi:hypothetical protein UlMin_041066 [Ulmus minor]